MKKIFLILFCFALLISSPKSLLAQVDTDPQTTFNTKKEELLQRLEERRIMRETRREEMRERILEKKATMAAKLMENRKGIIRNYFSRLIRRFNAVIERLERLISRIESRLAKIEEADEEIDTEAVHLELKDAKELIDEAVASLEAAQDNLEEVLNSDDPKGSFFIIKDTITDIKSQLIQVHAILVKVIGDIKGLRVGVE